MPAALSAESLFSGYFLPLYPEDVRGDLAAARATDANPANNPLLITQIEEAAEAFARLAPEAFGVSDLKLDYSDESVHRLGAALTRTVRDKWLEFPEGDELPMIVNVVLHGALYVGQCVVRSHGGSWQVRRPMWESLVRLDSRAGTGDLALFHWWLKALSDAEIDDHRLVDRYRANVEVVTALPEQLPIMASPDRRLPRLRRPRFDALHKHLRAHLPELRSVGDHFPSQQRWDEMAFEWLDFKLVGDGRMLVMHGPTDRGVHVFWMDIGGYSKSAFYPADAFPEHKLEAQGDKVRIIVPILGEPRVHEMLWWGL